MEPNKQQTVTKGHDWSKLGDATLVEIVSDVMNFGVVAGIIGVMVTYQHHADRARGHHRPHHQPRAAGKMLTPGPHG